MLATFLLRITMLGEVAAAGRHLVGIDRNAGAGGRRWVHGSVEVRSQFPAESDRVRDRQVLVGRSPI